MGFNCPFACHDLGDRTIPVFFWIGSLHAGNLTNSLYTFSYFNQMTLMYLWYFQVKKKVRRSRKVSVAPFVKQALRNIQKSNLKKKMVGLPLKWFHFCVLSRLHLLDTFLSTVICQSNLRGLLSEFWILNFWND